MADPKPSNPNSGPCNNTPPAQPDVNKPCTLTSLCQSPTPSPRSRTKVGVGEEVDLTYSPGSATWTISGGGRLASQSGSGNTFTAPDRAATVTITATGSGCAQSISFQVVEPSDIHNEKIPGRDEHINGRPSSGFHTRVFVLPADVSFHHVATREHDVGAVCSGYWAPKNGVGHDPHPATIPVAHCVEGKGSPMGGAGGEDHCYSGFVPENPTSAGQMVFHIPWEFSVNGGAPKVFAIVDQTTTTDAAGTTTTTKAGASSTAALNDPTHFPG